MNKFWKNVIMFIIGFSIYIALEVIWDNQSHYSMGIISGTMFWFGNWLNNRFSWKMDLLLQCGIITLFTTILEAIVGNIDYYFWHIGIWDYSSLSLSYFNNKINVFFILKQFYLYRKKLWNSTEFQYVLHASFPYYENLTLVWYTHWD